MTYSNVYTYAISNSGMCYTVYIAWQMCYVLWTKCQKCLTQFAETNTYIHYYVFLT